jgi:hypothetical protein
VEEYPIIDYKRFEEIVEDLVIQSLEGKMDTEIIGFITRIKWKAQFQKKKNA